MAGFRLSVLTVCLFLLVDGIFRHPTSKAVAFLWGAILACMFFSAMLEPQFTLTAALLFASAVALCFPGRELGKNIPRFTTA